MNNSLGSIALLVAFCAAACAAPLEEISDKTYPMPADGSLRLHNTDGTIYIYAWAESSLRVMTRKRSYSAERLREIAINVSLHDGAATIEATYPPKARGLSFADRSGTVDFLIFLPQKTTIANVELDTGELIVDGMYGMEVNASLTNGRMTAQNCFSNLHLKVTDGALDLIYDWGEPMRFDVAAEILRGHLRLGLPPYAAVQVDAESGDGKIFNQFARENEPAELMGRLRMITGDGSGADFKLRASRGNIGILKNE